ncbi:hypothetical protein [Streptomyces sp. NPDC005533]|uniref:hypothetical protein n=1 Tax=Streptomyces sp. NPDC005533 TaxID=3364723 RepID=UPI00368888E9
MDGSQGLALTPETLRGRAGRHKKQREPPAFAELTASEQIRLKELENRILEVQAENTFLKNARRITRKIPQQQASMSSSNNAARHCRMHLRSQVHA